MRHIPFKEAKLSIVTPVYNNAKTLDELILRVFAAAMPLFKEVEYIFVNDGSVDNSKELLVEKANKNKSIKVIDLARNFGQHTSLMTGLRFCMGDYVLFIDGDLEERPEDLSLYMSKMTEGYEVVMATRNNSNRNALRLLGAKLYSFFYNCLSDYKIIHNVCSMRLMTKKYISYLLRFNERPWIGGISSWIGLPIGLITVNVEHSKHKKSNYNLFKLLSHARLGIIGFSTKILRLAFVVGSLISSVSFLYGLSMLYVYFTDKALPGFTSIVVLVSFLMGIQFMFMGIIGEYIAEIFLSTKRRPDSLIYELYNFSNHTSYNKHISYEEGDILAEAFSR